MIPLKLSVRNFMCYKENVAPLLLDGVHIACLSGDNGNGKSALLDAITWVLWGQSRAKSDDELIHAGKLEMEVEFEFHLGSERFRVVRKRVLPKSGRGAGQTSLELQVSSGEDYRAITGNSVRETERKIIDLLRMDYQTFVNSAFLVQGRADEFTTKTATERKKVLADILGLSFYDELEERARQKARENEEERKSLARSIEELGREIDKKPTHEQELQEITFELHENEKSVLLQESRLSGLRETRKILDLKKDQLSEAESLVERATRELQELDSGIKASRQRLAKFETILSQEAAIEDGYLRLVEARKRSEILSQKVSQVVALSEKRNRLEKRIEEFRTRLLTEKEVLLSDLQRLEPKAHALPGLQSDLLLNQQRLTLLLQKETQRDEMRGQSQVFSNRIHLLRTTNDDLRKAMNALKDKLDLLAESEAKCPLCENDLDDATRENIEEKYHKEGKDKAAQFRTHEAEIRELERSLDDANKRSADLEAEVSRERGGLQRLLAVIEKNLDETKAAASEVGEKRQALVKVSDMLEHGDYCVAETADLHDVVRELNGLNYDSTEHDRIRKELHDLASFEALHNELETAKRYLGHERETISRDEKTIQRRKFEVEDGVRKKEVLTRELAGLPELVSQIAEAQESLSTLVRRQAFLKQLEGGVRQKLDHCRYLEQQKTERASAMQKAAQEKSIYDELALAFGKKGIQAMIIESAVPEIQDEANLLLARMTDNRMHVLIETQRDTKKGDTIETLDIKIADELGTRNYELFSGGEAFRANFAIRVALSKLLARRAGARLQTLIIDEGFGTQDAIGREKLVEAINSIAGEFERIIVITHIQELKDLFPVRIEVTKGPDGAAISMN